MFQWVLNASLNSCLVWYKLKTSEYILLKHCRIKKSKLAKKGSEKKKKIVKWMKKYEQLLNWSSWNFIRGRVNVFFLSIIITETKVWYNYHIFNSWYLFFWFLYLSSGNACFDTCYLTRSDTIKISFKNDSNNKFCELEATQNIIF